MFDACEIRPIPPSPPPPPIPGSPCDLRTLTERADFLPQWTDVDDKFVYGITVLLMLVALADHEIYTPGAHHRKNDL